MASFVSVRPNLSYHVVSSEAGRTRHVDRRDPPDRDSGSTAAFSSSSARSSTTFATARSSCASPSSGCVDERRLAAYEYDGFWMSMDTFKDRQQLEDIYARGDAPWQVWDEPRRCRRQTRSHATDARLSLIGAWPATSDCHTGTDRSGCCASARMLTTSKLAAAA